MTARRLCVWVTVFLVGCRLPADLPANGGLRGVTPDSTTATADGTSVMSITALVDTTALLAGSTVTISASAGTLLPSGNSVTVAVDSTGVARAQLRAPTDSAVARIVATFGTSVRTDSIIYRRALPDEIHVATTAGILSILGRNTAPITVALVRRFGLVSPNTPVSFTSYALGKPATPVGIVSPTVAYSGSSGATATFLPDTAYTGAVVVRAQTSGRNGALTDSVIIYVTK